MQFSAQNATILPMLTLLLSLAHAAPTSATITTVIDGDSFILDSGDRIQLRGVVAPVAGADYGIEARELVRHLVAEGEVYLAYRPGEEPVKRASVRTMEGDLAISLLEQGFAHLYILPPDNLDLTMLLTAQNAARAAGRGIWGTERFSGELHIVEFVANAEGDDRENVNGEYLRICNTGVRSMDLSGSTLRDKGGNLWVLPPMILPVGHTVLVHSGVGINQSDPAQQLMIYLGSDRPIWNNTEDQATLTDRAGKVVDAVKQYR
ncbi:MAG: endonuclease YncB(thermonuclease family) [Myxococcota bacterium]|jgi:endonuclease YncB( thermonuclease family)